MRTDKIQNHVSHSNYFRPRLLKFNRKRKRDQDFQAILDGYLFDTVEELEEYPVNLPRHTYDSDDDIEDVS